jgi:multidrug efflux system membrane fusion protein
MKSLSKNKKWLLIAIVIIGLLAEVLFIYPGFLTNGTGTGKSAPGGGGWGMRGAGAGLGFNRTQAVSAGVVRQMDIRVIVNAIGTMTALNTATVRAKVDSELKAIYFKEGQLVKAGQILVDLDAKPLEVQLTQAQGTLDRDTALYKNALLDLQRYKDLLTKDGVSAQQVDTQDALVRQLKGTVLTDQGLLDSAKLQLSYTHVVAPISGRLGLKQVELGSLVRSSDASGIVTITQFQPIAAVFAVPQKFVPTIQRRLVEREPLTVEVWDSESVKLLGRGKLSVTDNAIDASTGTLKLKALLDNKDESLFPNQFVNIKLELEVLKNALTVPNAAVQRGAQGTFVYVINEDSTVNTRVVKLLAQDGDYQAVQADIQAGQRVVIDGADRLREQSKVDVVKTIDANGRVLAGSAQPKPLDSKEADQIKDHQGQSNSSQSAATVHGSEAKDEKHNSSSQRSQGPASGSQQSSQHGLQNSISSEDQSDRRRQWRERLSPEEQEKVSSMTPDERRAYFRKMREQRQQSQGE